MNNQEAVLRVVREDEEGAITDANNVTSDTCSLAPSLNIENQKVIFTSEKLGKPDELVNAVKNTAINTYNKS